LFLLGLLFFASVFLLVGASYYLISLLVTVVTVASKALAARLAVAARVAKGLRAEQQAQVVREVTEAHATAKLEKIQSSRAGGSTRSATIRIDPTEEA
jgi:type II secretory pathway component PulK